MSLLKKIKLVHCIKKHLYILFCPLVMSLRFFFEYYVEDIIIDEKNYKTNLFINTFLFLVGYLLVGIVWGYEKKIEEDEIAEGKENRKEIFIRQNESLNQYEINEMEIKHTALTSAISKGILFGILNCIASLSSNIARVISSENEYMAVSSSAVSSKCLGAAIFGVIFLKNVKLNRHHIVSLFIIVIMNIVCIIGENLIEKDGARKFEIKWLLLVNIPEILYILLDTMIKRYYMKSVGSQFGIIFMMGFVGVIFLFALQIIAYFVPCNIKDIYCTDDNNIALIFENLNFNYKYILYYIGNVILAFFQTLFIFKVIYEFSANHFAAVAAVFHFLTSIEKLINSKVFPYLLLLYTLCYIFIIFGCLVFNEMIILYFCGLEKETFLEIRERELKDKKKNEKIEENNKRKNSVNKSDNDNYKIIENSDSDDENNCK